MNDAAARDALIARIATRYARRSHRAYVRSKLHWDPMFDAAASLLRDSPRTLLDVGCGLGLLGQYLRESGGRAPYRGLDLDARKIEAARAAAIRGGLDIELAIGSATELPSIRGDVALLDLLHYLPADAQKRVLAEAAARVAPDGVLIIRNVVREPGWRFAATRFEERAARAIGWIRSPTRHFPGRDEIESPLRSDGFSMHVAPLWGRTPFNSYLFVARRAGHD